MVSRYFRVRYRRFNRRARRFIVHHVLHADDPPYKLAMGVAVGVWLTFLPLVGIQMLLNVVVAWMLRANPIVGIPIVWISNPVTVVPIYYSLYLFGTVLLGVEPFDVAWFQQLFDPANMPPDWWPKIVYFWNALLEIFWPMWVGCLVFATSLAVPSYYITYYAVVGYRMNKWGSLTPPAAAVKPQPLAEAAPSLTLASGSPRRAKLLTEAGYAFEQRRPPFDDSRVAIDDSNVETLASTLAHAKAMSVATAEPIPDGIVIGCDTLLCVDGEPIGKPTDADDARRILTALFDRTHEVVTAVCLVNLHQHREVIFTDKAQVRIAAVDEPALGAYLDAGEWRDKAGGYNLDDLRDRWSIEVIGDPTTVIGLPMNKLAAELKRFIKPAQPTT